MKNYYHILNVSPKASAEEIKTAYRKLSKKLHPDQNDGDKYFEDFFKEVKEAYETLSDPSKRQSHNWDLENKQPKDTTKNSEQEQKLQRWFEELAERHQAAFLQKAEELKRVYKQQEAQFLTLEKQLNAKAAQSAQETKNIFLGASVIIVILLIVTGFALYSNSRTHNEHLQTRNPINTDFVSLEAQRKKEIEGEFWKKISLEPNVSRDAFTGISSREVCELYFTRNIDTLFQESIWRLNVAAQYLKNLKNNADIYIYAIANTAEPRDTGNTNMKAQELAERRALQI